MLVHWTKFRSEDRENKLKGVTIMKIRESGKKVLNMSWDMFCDMFSFIGLTYGIALGKKRANLGARIFFSALAGGLTTLGIIALLVVKPTPIFTGVRYSLAAVLAHYGRWDSDDFFIRTAYDLGYGVREHLAETNSFAGWLSVQPDALQIAVGIVCMAVVTALAVITIKCFVNFVAAVKLSHKKKAECKANAKVIPVSRKRAG